jgi:restriction endonuclease S subunit
MIFNEEYSAVFASFLIRIKLESEKVLPEYYWSFTKTDFYWNQAKDLVTGGGQPQFNANVLKEISFPLPPSVSNPKS